MLFLHSMMLAPATIHMFANRVLQEQNVENRIQSHNTKAFEEKPSRMGLLRKLEISLSNELGQKIHNINSFEQCFGGQNIAVQEIKKYQILLLELETSRSVAYWYGFSKLRG